jgi:hypothetical protein
MAVMASPEAILEWFVASFASEFDENERDIVFL